jgi:hypothetical protein
LVIHPIASAAYHIVSPLQVEEIKLVLQYLQKNRQEGDSLYLYFASEPGFLYYADRYELGGENNIILGKFLLEGLDGYKENLDQLKGRGRVWILFSHVYREDEKIFLEYLEGIGKKEDAYKAVGASVYLFGLPLSS